MPVDYTKKFIPEAELTDDEIEKLSNDPSWGRNEYGFYRRPDLKSFKTMNEAELLQYRDSEDSFSATAAEEEQKRRRELEVAKLNHRLDLKNGIIIAIVSWIFGVLVSPCYKYLIGFWDYAVQELRKIFNI